MSGIIRGPASPIYVPDGIGVGGGGVILGKGPAEPVYLVDATGQIFDISDMYAEVQKIDSAPTDGLLGVRDSLAYRLHKIEDHFHNDERWFGAANVPVGEDHVADPIGVTVTPFQVDAGNDTWGDWTQLAGTLDYPAGWQYADVRRIEVVTIERTNATHLIQVARGASGAVALVNDTYTEYLFRPTTVQGRSVPLQLLSDRSTIGVKWWIRSWVIGQDTGLMSLYVGAHGYAG